MSSSNRKTLVAVGSRREEEEQPPERLGSSPLGFQLNHETCNPTCLRRSVQAQVQALVQAWQWSHSDTILHALPLHHIHGIVNALYCPAYAGAQVDFQPKFSAGQVWQEVMVRAPLSFSLSPSPLSHRERVCRLPSLSSSLRKHTHARTHTHTHTHAKNKQDGKLSVFMGVPTMYSYLLSHYDGNMSPEEQARARAAASALRLTVSGSSACPVPIMERWKELTGNYLLERWGSRAGERVCVSERERERERESVCVCIRNSALR